MATYHLPVIFAIDADSIEEAQNALVEWGDSIDLNQDVPTGTEDIDIAPNCESNDEGQRVLYLPALEEDPDTDESIEEEDFADDSDDV